jgi:allantoinase
LIPGNLDRIEPLIAAGILGMKAFLIHSGLDEFPNVNETDLHASMPLLAKHNLPLLVHAEIDSNHKFKNGAAGDYPKAVNSAKLTRRYQTYLESRPRTWENRAIHRMIRLARKYACHVHIVHLSSTDTIPALSEARRNGLPITVETCPHYLFFEAENIPAGETRLKCAPPIREQENREKLWQALKDGIIETIASNHSPCPVEMKYLEQGDFQKARGGISSLQFSLPVVWTEARQRGFSLEDIARWMCKRPAEIVGLGAKKGAIAKGCDADIVVFDAEQQFSVSSSLIRYRHKFTPYEGHTLTGVVEKTFLRGRQVYDNGKLTDTPAGKILLRVKK